MWELRRKEARVRRRHAADISRKTGIRILNGRNIIKNLLRRRSHKSGVMFSSGGGEAIVRGVPTKWPEIKPGAIRSTRSL